MRDDPTAGLEATLLVRLPDGVDPAVVSEPAASVGATYSGATTFGDAEVRVDQSDVAALLDALPGSVEAVETDAVTGVTGDAGEDL